MTIKVLHSLIVILFPLKRIFTKEIFLGKKRKAIVKGNAAVEFGNRSSGSSFLGVGLMSKYINLSVVSFASF